MIRLVIVPGHVDDQVGHSTQVLQNVEVCEDITKAVAGGVVGQQGCGGSTGVQWWINRGVVGQQGCGGSTGGALGFQK